MDINQLIAAAIESEVQKRFFELIKRAETAEAKLNAMDEANVEAKAATLDAICERFEMGRLYIAEFLDDVARNASAAVSCAEFLCCEVKDLKWHVDRLRSEANLLELEVDNLSSKLEEQDHSELVERLTDMLGCNTDEVLGEIEELIETRDSNENLKRALSDLLDEY